MWDRLAGTLKHGTSPPERERERKGFNFYGLGLGPFSSNSVNNANVNNSFDSWHETSGGNGTYSYSIQGGARSPVGNLGASPLIFEDPEEFDELEFAQVPGRNQQGASAGFRPTSSIYSQGYPTPSPQQTQFAPSARKAVPRPTIQTDAAGISPPSSPEIAALGHGHNHESPEISPIDEAIPDMSQPANSAYRRPGEVRPPSQNQQRSESPRNIPMMRRERRQNQQAAANTVRQAKSREGLQPTSPDKEEVRWDPRTGERTTKQNGRPGQVKPAEYAQGLGKSPNSPDAAAPKNPMTMFGERVRRLARPADRGAKPEPSTSDSGRNRVPSDTDPASKAFSSDRPEWRGASGRTALVAPVKDNRNVAPLVEIPRKSSKRMTLAKGAGNRGQPTPVASPLASPLSGGAETPNGAQSPQPLEVPAGAIRQVVPSSQQQSAPIDASDAGNASAQAQYPSPPPEERAGGAVPAEEQTDQKPLTQLEKARAAFKRKPPPSTHQNPGFGHAHDNSVGSVYSQDSSVQEITGPRPPPHGANPTTVGGSDAPPTDGWTQPASRFSVTTYATSSRSSHDLPRESIEEADRPPMPTLPTELLSAGTGREPPNNVMDRKRPKMLNQQLADRDNDAVYDASTPVVISLKDNPYMSSPFGSGVKSGYNQRKAVGSQPANPSPSALARARTNQISNSSSNSRPSSIFSTATNTNKDLPPAPPETSATSARDRVALLNAQLSGLGNRRINLNRSIKQMTELMPTDTIMATAEVLHKREVEKRKVEVLKEELADVQRQEYELGLKLHRAYKRLERDADCEGTALWVRRVTG